MRRVVPYKEEITLEDHNTLVMEKDYKGHHIHLLAQLEDEHWNVIARCNKCEMHMLMPGVQFTSDNSMMFVDAELQMHSFGNTDGWHEGYGFVIRD